MVGLTQRVIDLELLARVILFFLSLCSPLFRYKSNIALFILVSAQRFEIDILRESVIIGNDALFKCSIPSFVADFVTVTGWVDSEGGVVTGVGGGAWGG